MTATMAATLALVMVLIIALDYLFRGEISVTPDPFIMTHSHGLIHRPIKNKARGIGNGCRNSFNGIC
jgi:hypothetical protein